ncbi:hypothetical protein ACP3V3_11700, partial [Vibrio sp. PNB22_3_1]
PSSLALPDFLNIAFPESLHQFLSSGPYPVFEVIFSEFLDGVDGIRNGTLSAFLRVISSDTIHPTQLPST